MVFSMGGGGDIPWGGGGGLTAVNDTPACLGRIRSGTGIITGTVKYLECFSQPFSPTLYKLGNVQ